MIAEHQSVSMDAAFALIRAFARTHSLLLTETAENIVNGRVTIATLIQQ
jgi:hypothetical protein